MARITKARYWVGVLYPENMRANWEDEIDDIIQLPYAYCIHDLDTDSESEHRKEHVHLIIVFPNTTTYSHAFNVFDLLSAEGKKALNTIQAVVNIRSSYNYLIHDTEKCKKNGKYLYPAEARITGNNFDIGAYEQLGVAEISEIKRNLYKLIREKEFINIMDFLVYVEDNIDDINYLDIAMDNLGRFEKMTKGNFQKKLCFFSPSQENSTQNTQKSMQKCCPKCGSLHLRKNGQTPSGKGRWRCMDCGKSFSE